MVSLGDFNNQELVSIINELCDNLINEIDKCVKQSYLRNSMAQYYNYNRKLSTFWSEDQGAEN